MLWLIIFILSVTAGIIIYVLRLLYYKLKLIAILNLVYDRAFSVAGAFEGEDIYLIETVYNKSFIPLFFADIEFYLFNELKTAGYEASSDKTNYISNKNSAMQSVMSRFHLMPFMKIIRRHKLNCYKRGYYKLENIAIPYKDTAVYKRSDVELYVYPRLVELKYNSKPFNLIQGNVISLSRIITDPFLISGIRDYQTGDPFNLINFKATAKSSVNHSIKVNQLDYTSIRSFLIYINFQQPFESSILGGTYEKIMEKALSFSASFINEALQNGYRVGLSANCMMADGEMKIDFPQVSGLYHIEEILKELAKIQLRMGLSFVSLLNRGINHYIRDSEIFVMTMYMDDSIAEKIEILKRLNNTVNIIELTE